MIKEIIELLKTDDFYGVDADVDIAKGKYKYPERFKDFKERKRRNK